MAKYQRLEQDDRNHLVVPATTAPANVVDANGLVDDEEECVILTDAQKLDDRASKIKDLEKKLQDAIGATGERELRKGEVEELFDQRIIELECKADECEEAAADATETLDFLLNPPEEEPPPPGPYWLKWILSDYFNCLATLVIVTNIVLMVLELITPELEDTFFWYDQSFMVFYIMEIVLKVCLLHGTFFCGGFGVVFWNWLDFIIVLSGVLDMYLQPLLVMTGVVASGGHSLKFLSFLRLLRLLRILKIIGMFIKADMAWARSETFSVFIMGVIGFNSVLMGLESDLPDFFLWFYIEQMLLIIFSFELMTRLKFFGLEFFYHKTDVAWNILDFTIVMGGIVDQWLMPAIALVKFLMGCKPSGKGGNMGQVMMMLRMARLLRILRLVRLVKNIPPLYTLVVGIMQAMQGMMWVVILTFVILYACSLLSVKLIGQGLAFPDGAPWDVAAIFPTIFDSMFVLFKAMNGDWGALTPLFNIMPASKCIFFVYTVVSTWGILSILTAVVSENMINATDELRCEVEKEEDRLAEIEREENLTELFTEVCGDDCLINKQEFLELINNEDNKEKLKDTSGLEDWELRDIFKYLSKYDEKKKKPVIKLKDFIDGLKSEKRVVSERTMMRLGRRIKDFEKFVRNCARELLKEQRHTGTLHPDIERFCDTEQEEDEEAEH